MRASYLLFLPAVFFVSCATDAPVTPEGAFKTADANGDGLLAREEATNLLIADAFARYDANGDGTVDAEEYKAGGGDAEGFAKLNSSGSGALTLEEAQANPAAVERMALPFDEADVNGNGSITLDEFLTYRRELEAAVR